MPVSATYSTKDSFGFEMTNPTTNVVRFLIWISVGGIGVAALASRVALSLIK